MNKENDLIFLTSLVAIGFIVVSGLATYFHSIKLIPLVIIGFILLILILLTNKGNFSHKIESIEKVMFFITFFIIVISFILLYKPC